MRGKDLVVGDLLIRNCKIGDLSSIEQIEKASFDDPYSAVIFWSLYLDPKNFFRVGVIDRKIVGYSIVKVESGVESKLAHLVSLAIAPNSRRRGYGEKLLQDAIDLVRQDSLRINKIVLEVRSDNSTAIALYAKFGFTQESTVSDYYGKGKDALVMKLDLSKSC